MLRLITFRLANWTNDPEEYDKDSRVVDENFCDETATNTSHKRVSKVNVKRLHLMDEEYKLVKRRRKTIYTLAGKRCIDLIASSFVILFVLSWLVPIIGLLIYIDSRGPFYFYQKRTGYMAEPFSCLKFRTMIPHSHNGEFQQATKDDARITRLGRFLRKTNLDEMLQFINVFLGNMTLVGPRPHAVLHDAMHWHEPTYRKRYLVKPGITGLAQIKGARGSTTHPQSMDHRVRYDHFYINRQTFLLDMKICIRTVKLTLKGDSNAW